MHCPWPGAFAGIGRKHNAIHGSISRTLRKLTRHRLRCMRTRGCQHCPSQVPRHSSRHWSLVRRSMHIKSAPKDCNASPVDHGPKIRTPLCQVPSHPPPPAGLRPAQSHIANIRGPRLLLDCHCHLRHQLAKANVPTCRPLALEISGHASRRASRTVQPPCANQGSRQAFWLHMVLAQSDMLLRLGPGDHPASHSSHSTLKLCRSTLGLSPASWALAFRHD